MNDSTMLQLKRDYNIDIWLDDFSLQMCKNGELDRLIGQGLCGMTTNPSIFYNAIRTGSNYKDKIASLKSIGLNSTALLLQIMSEAVRDVADHFNQMFVQSSGESGYVSIELDPNISHNSKKMEVEAEFLWKNIDRKNILIKIPATEEGVKAIENTIAKGINVNVTLIFSLQQYLSVISAYKKGIEKAQKNNIDIAHIYSVASVFISRIDTMVEKDMELSKEDIGKAAVCNTILLYREYVNSFNDDSWLSEYGDIRAQKLLFASTGTKNKEYHPLKYVRELLYSNVVSTLPRKTLDELMNVDRIRGAGNMSFEEAYRHALAFTERVDITSLFNRLLADGEEIFIKAWNSTVELIEKV